ncbi:MFS multidrug transporter [Stagonosporopsis vannaccii]|nr:MFS multidrug transporter [Stagonosporopsis vannaccii]
MSSDRFDKFISYIPYAVAFVLVTLYFIFVLPHIQDYVVVASGYITAAQTAAHSQEFPRGCPPQSTSADVNSGARRSLHQRRESAQFPLPSPRPPTTPTIMITEPNGPTYNVESPSENLGEIEPTWLNMPNKRALAILALSRLVDFWQMASLQSYMIEQLRSFDVGIPAALLSYQAGVLQGSFTFAQIITSILWGRAADSPLIGRKTVLLIGLLGTGISCIGVAFSQSFIEMVMWRVLGGAINGTVGAARTMVAESVDKKWHSRAFLLLPVAFNVANILGPVVGGTLVHPVLTYPRAFSNAHASSLLEAFPYALPSLLCTVLLFTEAALVTVFLDETLATKRHDRSFTDQITAMYRGVVTILFSRASQNMHHTSEKYERTSYRSARLPFSKIWTPNVLWTLLSVAIFDLHMGAFSGLWIIFLSTPRVTPAQTTHIDAIHFTGGLSFSPSLLGSSLAILGVVGLTLQILLYPWANARFGLMQCFRSSLLLFPLAYFLAPYLVLLPSGTAPPKPASGVMVWLGISLVLTLQVSARTFALPASIILVNNASPHPSVLGTIHGVGQSVSSAMRTLGPVAGGYWFGLGLEKDIVGLGWWAIAGISAFGCLASLWVRNGSGYEVVLQEDDESTDDRNRS